MSAVPQHDDTEPPPAELSAAIASKNDLAKLRRAREALVKKQMERANKRRKILAGECATDESANALNVHTVIESVSGFAHSVNTSELPTKRSVSESIPNSSTSPGTSPSSDISSPKLIHTTSRGELVSPGKSSRTTSPGTYALDHSHYKWVYRRHNS